MEIPSFTEVIINLYVNVSVVGLPSIHSELSAV